MNVSLLIMDFKIHYWRMRGEKSKLLKMYLHEQMKPGDDSI